MHDDKGNTYQDIKIDSNQQNGNHNNPPPNDDHYSEYESEYYDDEYLQCDGKCLQECGGKACIDEYMKEVQNSSDPSCKTVFEFLNYIPFIAKPGSKKQSEDQFEIHYGEPLECKGKDDTTTCIDESIKDQKFQCKEILFKPHKQYDDNKQSVDQQQNQNPSSVWLCLNQKELYLPVDHENDPFFKCESFIKYNTTNPQLQKGIACSEKCIQELEEREQKRENHGDDGENSNIIKFGMLLMLLIFNIL